jgi:hypothetical protein
MCNNYRISLNVHVLYYTLPTHTEGAGRFHWDALHKGVEERYEHFYFPFFIEFPMYVHISTFKLLAYSWYGWAVRICWNEGTTVLTMQKMKMNIPTSQLFNA